MSLNPEIEIFSNDEWRGLVDTLSLSKRQSELVKHLFSGFSDYQIAQTMGISIPTVRTYMTRLFTKFNIEDRHELILHVFSKFRQECGALGCPRCQ